MELANYRNNTAAQRMLWAAGAAIAIALLLQEGAIAQGFQPGYMPSGGPQYAAPVAPQYAAAPADAPQGTAAAFEGQISQEAINAAVDRRLAEIEAQKKAEEAQRKQCADQQGYVVGSDLNLSVKLHDGLFLWLETPNKDFTMHIGGWMQLDNVWWNQTDAIKVAKGANAGSSQGVASGDTLGGIGGANNDGLQDGTDFRRIRPFVEGTFWETGEYRLIVALENDQDDTSGLDEFWVGLKDIPLVNSVRIGHVKDPMGLEGDMTASSRCMTFMERSSYSEAIELNQNFVTGLWASNNYLDQRVTWEAAAFRTDVAAAEGTYYGDGQGGVQGRVTCLPLYEDEGRELLHLGISGGWRSGSATLSSNQYRTISLSARSEMRDDDPSGAGLVPNSDSTRMINTGTIALGEDYIMGLEALWIRGPLSFQAEYGWNWVDDAIGIINSGAALNPKLTPPQNYVFNGGYVQVAYTLTGENRAYDKRIGTLAREYFGHEGPYSKAYIVRDADGNICSSWGAWEVAARYSYTDLNDGSGTNRIQGGEMDGVCLALNWYLNNNLNVMLDWAYDNRYDVPTVTSGTPNATNSTVPGYTSGYGVRVQFQF